MESETKHKFQEIDKRLNEQGEDIKVNEITTNLIKEVVQNIDFKMDKVVGYLHNNPATGEKGIVAKITDHEMRLSSIETEKKTEKIIAKKVARMHGLKWGSISGCVGWFVPWLIEHSSAVIKFFTLTK